MMDVLLFVMNEKISFVCIRGNNTQMSSLKNQSILAPTTKKVKKSRKKKQERREPKRDIFGRQFLCTFWWCFLVCELSQPQKRVF